MTGTNFGEFLRSHMCAQSLFRNRTSVSTAVQSIRLYRMHLLGMNANHTAKYENDLRTRHFFFIIIITIIHMSQTYSQTQHHACRVSGRVRRIKSYIADNRLPFVYCLNGKCRSDNVCFNFRTKWTGAVTWVRLGWIRCSYSF